MNFFLNSLILALRTLSQRKGRALLTILGIVIGIASFIIIMSVGAGAQSLIVNQITSVGSNLIGIVPGGDEEGSPPAALFGITITTLTYEDGVALENNPQAPYIEAVAMYVKSVEQVSWQSQSTDVTVTGTSAKYTIVEGADVQIGRFISSDEEKNLARVVVLGSSVAEELFGATEPINQFVRIKRERFRVIGVMESQGVTGFQDQDDQVFVPVRTAQRLLIGINHVNLMRVKVVDTAYVKETQEHIKAILRDRHNIREGEVGDFSVQNQLQALDVLTSITDALRYFLAAIGGIALLVGGIGIMNIMLVSIMERVREVGLRKAVGARARHILMQFLVETTIITLIGGIIGMMIGGAIAWLVAFIAQYLGYQWDFIVSMQSISIATVLSLTIGILFGLYPAMRAAKMNPIEALRYE